jgi:DNA-binding CsgD family transcriptional regulator
VGTETEFLHVVDHIQAAALDESLWSSALDSIADMLGAAVATSELIDIGQGRPVFAEFSERLSADIENQYIEYYSRINPRVADGIGRQVGAVRYDHAFLSEAEIDRDEFYADFISPLDLKYFISGHVLCSPRHASLFAVQRSAAQGHVGDDEISLIQRLIPHMRHALDVRIRLAKSGQRDGGLLNGLAAYDEAAVLVDRGGRILYENAAARDVYSNVDGVNSSGRLLQFSDLVADAQFGEALAGLLATEGDSIDMHTRSFAARRPSGRRPYAVSVRALPVADAFAEALLGAAAVVFIRDPETYALLDKDLLIQSYGLTAAEADLAAMFDTGASLVDIADRRGVSISTVRTQLYTLMAKLDVNRQTELVRLLRQYRLDF